MQQACDKTIADKQLTHNRHTRDGHAAGMRQKANTHVKQGKLFTFSPMRGSTSLMTGLVALAKDLILARSVMILTGRNLAVATIAQFQKAAGIFIHIT